MNKKTLIIPKQIVTMNAEMEILRNHGVQINNGIIEKVCSLKGFDYEKYPGDIYVCNDLTLLPGFVQTHVHLCQSLFRGLADDMELLDWLQKRIFPYENSHNEKSLRLSAQLGISEIIESGTTTILDMGTINHQEVVFEEMISSGIRGFSGKCMIDENDLYPAFKESTEQSLSTSYELAKTFHNSADGRIQYAFAPRFALSCSEGLLKDTFKMTNDFNGSLYHTHSSENKGEIEAVKQKYGKENIEFFDSINVLSDRTILAHCIHTNEKEIELLKNSQTRVAHCPSSNMKLGSGIADIPGYLNKGISVSLGADGAPCNNNLSMFTEMRLATLIQKPIHGSTTMDAKTMVKMATIDGAKALHLDGQIGSIEVGKKADLVLLNLRQVSNSLLNKDENIYSDIVYSSNDNSVSDVMISGKWVVRKGKSTFYNAEKLIHDARQELKKLLRRTDIG
ncbi:Guanine deaminase [hydrothermal vent metagenome]|uniref:Guanine deaminase n=1 Tax=hydrothermal vent metagenome TaxID=652676 RepID=A0A3B1CM88_9ZZZZ